MIGQGDLSAPLSGIMRSSPWSKVWPKLGMSWEICKEADKGSINVGGGLRFLEERPRIGEGICHIRPANHRPHQNIWIRVRAEEVLGPRLTPNVRRVGMYRWQRARPVVDPLRVAWTIPHHVGHSQWIIPKNIVNLPRQRITVHQ